VCANVSRPDSMILGFSGRHADAAVALVTDGVLLAAATEESFARIANVGYRQTGGFPFRAAEACLRRAGVAAGDVRTVVAVGLSGSDRIERQIGTRTLRIPSNGTLSKAFVESGLAERPFVRVAPLSAHAAQAAAVTPGGPALLAVLDEDPKIGAGVFIRREDKLELLRRVAGPEKLRVAAEEVARCLGCDSEGAVQVLERLGEAAEPSLLESFRETLAWDEPSGVTLRPDLLAGILERSRASAPGSLADGDSPNIRLQEHRQCLAASFSARLIEIIVQICAAARESAGIETLAVSGSFFSSGGVNRRLSNSLGGGLYVAPVPERAGLALGAALAASHARTTASLDRLAVGPSFSEEEVKAALENCRLDYVYEPNWHRLLTRVSRMLSRGKTIAWFQGAMDFGPRSLGSRSILADPSNRYARENINRYLRQRRQEEPLPVSLTERAADECLIGPVRSPFMLFRASVKEDWRDRFRAALDPGDTLTVHTVAPTQSPELYDLLERHQQETGVSGLINVPLRGPGEPMACAPRDAIRTTFSSAIDALVMKRFLVMKDYWLLRSSVDG